MISKVISGGQTGADLGALLGARDAGVATGGWAPLGWRTDNGAAFWLADFGLREHHRYEYPPRTRENVWCADATLIIGNLDSPGCRLTLRLCREFNKPVHSVVWPMPVPSEEGAFLSIAEAATWAHDVSVLNVAGNRESRNPGIQEAVRAFVRLLLQKVNSR